MASAPRFYAKGIDTTAQISAANPNLDGTGTVVDVATGDVNGTRIEAVNCKAIATTTAGIIRFFIYDETNTRLVGELAVSAVTPSATVLAFSGVWTPPYQLILAQNWVLRASTEKAEIFNLNGQGGSY